MNELEIRRYLAALPLRGWRYHQEVDSTNTAALAWAAEGAPDLSLVYAEEQTAGRGRGVRRWHSSGQGSLTFSLVLRPSPQETVAIPFFTALGSLAVCEAAGALGVLPEIKWPNDVLSSGKKFCGILTEATWMGEKPEAVIVGIGVNVARGALPPDEEMDLPATTLEAECGRPVERIPLLKDIVQALLYWRGHLTHPLFRRAWEERLAFRGKSVLIRQEGGVETCGVIEGLETDGRLRIRTAEGQAVTINQGEVHLRLLV